MIHGSRVNGKLASYFPRSLRIHMGTYAPIDNYGLVERRFIVKYKRERKKERKKD